MSDSFDLDAIMARPLSTARLAGSSRAPLQTDADLEGHYGDDAYRPWTPDEPISHDVTATGEWQDAAAEQVDAGEFDPDDRWDRPHMPDWDATL